VSVVELFGFVSFADFTFISDFFYL